MARMNKITLLCGICAALMLFGLPAVQAKESVTPTTTTTMDVVAESFVKFCLKLDLYDPGFVDAYIGPENWKPAPLSAEAAAAPTKPWGTLIAEVDVMMQQLDGLNDKQFTPTDKYRQQFLKKSLIAAKGRIELLSGKKFSFDEETTLLFDAKAPTHSDRSFTEQLKALEALLPGEGDLATRYQTFRAQFAVPPAKLDAVFKAAINESRRRTTRQIPLPKNENFTVAYVTGKSWNAYNWYKGNYQSLIEVNTDQPIYIDRIITLASHEGYPGHHVQNILREKLYKNKKWVEFAVYPLYNPSSLFLEGAANYGVEVAFPGSEKLAFERDILYPLAGLDPKLAEKYDQVTKLRDKLYTNLRTETARRFLDGKITEAAAEKMLMQYGLEATGLAQRSIKFFKAYRSYIINYDIGQDMVHNYVEMKVAGNKDARTARWAMLDEIFSTPMVPSDLRTDAATKK